MVSDTPDSTPTKDKRKVKSKGKGKAKAPTTPEPEIKTKAAASDGDVNSDGTATDEMLRAFLPFRGSPKTTTPKSDQKSLDDEADTSNLAIFSSEEEVEVTATPEDKKRKENARKAAQKKKKQQAKKDAAAATLNDEVDASSTNNNAPSSINESMENLTTKDGKGKVKAGSYVASTTFGATLAPGEKRGDQLLPDRTRKVLRSVEAVKAFVKARPVVSDPNENKAIKAAYKRLQATVMKLHVMLVSPGHDISPDATRATINLYAEQAGVLVNYDPIKIMPTSFTTLTPKSDDEHRLLFQELCKFMTKTIVLNLPTYKSGKFLGMINPEFFLGDALECLLRSPLLTHPEKTTITALYTNITSRENGGPHFSLTGPETFATFTVFDMAQIAPHWGGMMAMLFDSIPAPKGKAITYYGPRKLEPIGLPNYGFPSINPDEPADYTVIDTLKAEQVRRRHEEVVTALGADTVMKMINDMAKKDAAEGGVAEEGAKE